MQVAAGWLHSFALKVDGTLWSWGRNSSGQLGDGTNKNRLVPIQVSGLTGVVQVSGGGQHTLALKSDGTVWAWGENSSGQVGDGTNNNRNAPVKVSGLTGIVQVAAGGSHSMALKSDGTVWVWGSDLISQLGDANFTDQNTPIQVSGLTGIVQVSAGFLHSLALKSDGTVWSWGDNTYGELGDGSGDFHFTPNQVAGLTGVAQIATMEVHCLALKSDGTVWSWGYDFYGELGVGGTVDMALAPLAVLYSSTPNQNYIAIGGHHSLSVQAVVLNSKLTTSALTQPLGKAFNTTARLKDQRGLMLAFKQVSLSIDGTAIGVATTDASGIATFAITNSAQYAIGAHTLKVSFAGDRLFNASTASATLTITQASTQISPASTSGKAGAVVALKAKLLRSTDKAVLANKTLRFQIDGADVGTATTATTGIASLNYTIPTGMSTGAHPIKVFFDGDASYLSGSASSATLTVK